MKLIIRNNLKYKTTGCWQVTTPYIALWSNNETYCIVVGLFIFDFEFWLGKKAELKNT